MNLKYKVPDNDCLGQQGSKDATERMNCTNDYIRIVSTYLVLQFALQSFTYDIADKMNNFNDTVPTTNTSENITENICFLKATR